MKFSVILAIGFMPILLTGTAFADDGEPISIPQTYVHHLHSEILGEAVTIMVALPFGYRADSQHPALYITDATAMMGLVTEYVRLMSFEQSQMNHIIVGVAYSSYGRWLERRAIDYHPNAQDANGGLVAFSKAIEEEIKPFIKNHYRTNGLDLFYGHSSGALVALYNAIYQPTRYTHILASSPSLDEEQAWSNRLIKAASGSDLSQLPRLYISCGDQETKTQPWLTRLQAALKTNASVADQQFALASFENQKHMAVIGPALASGLHWLVAP